jgi:hypothetical protein
MLLSETVGAEAYHIIRLPIIDDRLRSFKHIAKLRGCKKRRDDRNVLPQRSQNGGSMWYKPPMKYTHPYITNKFLRECFARELNELRIGMRGSDNDAMKDYLRLAWSRASGR